MLQVQEKIYPPQILLMEDEPNVAKGLEIVLSDEGYRVDLALTGRSALEKFKRQGVDLLVADLRLPDMDGMEVIRQVKDRRPDTGVVVITGYSNVPTAVKAMKLGAFDFLPKPFTDDEFKFTVNEALKRKRVLSVVELTETEEGRLIQKREVIRVLERAADELYFSRDLMERGSKALEGYKLSSEAKAAIVSGDLKWLMVNVGELTEQQLHWVLHRLQREIW